MGKLLKIKGFILGHKKTSVFIILILAGTGYFVFRDGNSEAGTKMLNEARSGSIVQEVSVTGKVVSAQAVDLSFQSSGKVVFIGVKSGDRVRADQLLISLDSGELTAQRARDVATVQAAQYRLDQIEAGQDLSSLKNTLDSAEKNLIQTRVYGSIDRIRQSTQLAIRSLATLSDIQTKYFNDRSADSMEIVSAKEMALKAIYNQDNLGEAQAWYFVPLKTGLNELIIEAEKADPLYDYEGLLGKVKSALLLTSNSLVVTTGKLSKVSGVATADSTAINTAIDTINSQITLVTTQEQSILTAKNSVSDAKTKVSSYNTFDSAIAVTDLDKARAQLAITESQLSKYAIRAPFRGVATNVDVKVGELISPNVTAVSLVGDAKFQIETSVSEADIAKIKIGNDAVVTLDAYGQDVKFSAKVIHVDPAGRIIEGVATYKVTLEFNDNDSRFLSGLTANVDILTNKAENVLYVSSRNIFSSTEGTKYVKVRVKKDFSSPRFEGLTATPLNGEYKVYEVTVRTGLKGSDGKTEIIEGLEPGDIIIGE